MLWTHDATSAMILCGVLHSSHHHGCDGGEGVVVVHVQGMLLPLFECCTPFSWCVLIVTVMAMGIKCGGIT